MEKFRPPLQWVGGKYWLIDHFQGIAPFIEGRLVSPFLGGGALEINLAHNFGIEIIGRDINADLINYWQHMLGNPDGVVEKAYGLVVNEAREDLDLEWADKSDPWGLRRAGLFRLVNKMSFQSGMARLLPYNMAAGSEGVSVEYKGRAFCFEYAHSDKLKTIQMHVDVSDFQETLEEYPDDFLYLDPPYISWSAQSERGAQDSYYSGVFDHGMLNELLKRRDNWILSYGHLPQIPYIELAYAGYYFRKFPKKSSWNKRRRVEGECEKLIFSHDMAEKVRGASLF